MLLQDQILGPVPKNLCRKQRRTLQATSHTAAFPSNNQTCKSIGKGYTSVLSRILESALENPDIVKHYL